MKPQEVLALCRERNVKAVDLRFADLLGGWQRFTVPVARLDADAFEDGLGFDGSNIRAWQAVSRGDVLVVPQPDTAFLDPFAPLATLVMICDVQDPVTREDCDRDPRNVARKAVNYLKSTRIADTCLVGATMEFYVFDDVSFQQHRHTGGYRIESVEGRRNRRDEGGAANVSTDQMRDIGNEVMQAAVDCGLSVAALSRKTTSAGQMEIELNSQPLVRMGDFALTVKHIVKNIARKCGKTATFMPKPLFGDNGSGMSTRLSFSKEGQPLLAGSGYAGLSETALHAIGGIIRHAPSILAFSCPSANSYKRLAPGCKAPIALAYAQRNPSAACRIPLGSASPKNKRLEFRCPDPSCNPYLSFSAILLAAVDGIQCKMHPGEPHENDVGASLEELALVPKAPGSLEESLAALRQDQEYLLRGDAFTRELIDTWISCKLEHEVDALRLRPHPYDFCLYYDI